MLEEHQTISPIDNRYWDEEIVKYLSEEAFLRYKLDVEIALVWALPNCLPEFSDEIQSACQRITLQEVSEEESKTHHDIRALVNCIRNRVSEEAKPYVHLTATSSDIISCANALRFRDAVQEVLLPRLLQLEKVLINIIIREAGTMQIGRTHGQHAIPITFGFAIAEYVHRLGYCIEKITESAQDLRGKFSGADGSYNALKLLFADPEDVEKNILTELELKPSEHSTQIVPPEYITRLFFDVIMAFGVLANLADDMRHLQRSEIAEVGEEFGDEQVGSSTMPQKRNPISFENIKSLWKLVMPRMTTLFMDQISEHQRDLSNSASARTYGEILAYTAYATKRLSKIMERLSVNKDALLKNLEMSGDLIMAEPLYLLLAAEGDPDAHDKVRQWALKAEKEDKSLLDVAKEADPYVEIISMFNRPELDFKEYVGIAEEKAIKVADYWTQKLGLNP